jgi:signal transduction histidine kinase
VNGLQTSSDDARREILRQASVALGGRPVTLWEVSARAELDPQLSSDPTPTHHATHLDVETTLRRWSIPILQGSRWVGCRSDSEGPWIIAPVRTRPPAPPPGGTERRGRERLTLELAGLCVGLVDGRGHTPVASAPPAETAQRDLTNLPGVMAHELGNRLTTARVALQLAMEGVGRWTDVAAGRRLELLDELGLVLDDIDRGAQFLRAVKDRARGALARWERFDAVRVVQSCCTLEGRVLKDRVPLALEGAPESTYLLGDPNALYDALVNLIRNAADASAGQPTPVEVRLERTGQSLRVSVRDRGVGIAAQHLDRIFEPGFTTKGFGEGTGMGLVMVRDVVHNMFGGSIAVDSAVGVGTAFTLTFPIPPQRTGDPRSSAQLPPEPRAA